MKLKSVLGKLSVLFISGALCIGLSGCDESTDGVSIYFGNNSSDEVTVYWGRYDHHSYPYSFVLEPGEYREIEGCEASDHEAIYYDWYPKAYVWARQIHKDEVEFLDR